jgi:hypothetical protein
MTETTLHNDESKSAAVPSVILVPVSPGELLDKISILDIKAARLTEPAKLGHVHQELALLAAARDRAIRPSAELARLAAELRAVNEALWQVEDDVRVCERRGDFGPRFVQLARSVYRLNDQRAAVKREINELLASPLMEEKSYAPRP